MFIFVQSPNKGHKEFKNLFVLCGFVVNFSVALKARISALNGYFSALCKESLDLKD